MIRTAVSLFGVLDLLDLYEKVDPELLRVGSMAKHECVELF
jgi:hypothetical protein